MDERGVIAAALDAAALPPLESARPLAGGCICSVLRVDLQDGLTVVAKCGDVGAASLFEEERRSLESLAVTGTVLVPEVLAVGAYGGGAVLLLSWCRPHAPTPAAWERFGRELAALHRSAPSDRYGFEIDNHLGVTPQPNGWCDDWVEFNRRHRLGPQIDRARSRNLLSGDAHDRLTRLVTRLDRVLPSSPPPALLHGDLWSGNALPTLDDDGLARVALVDPACSIGDGWADIAMMQLFGGFPPECFRAYADSVETDDTIDRRIAVYQLYHLLNHLNLFGPGYSGQVTAGVQRLEEWM